MEADDRLGGRVATDVVDGYLLDRGFQVLNTAYPRLGTLLDLDTARPAATSPPACWSGAGDELRRLVNPLREPPAGPATALAGVGSLRRPAALRRARHRLRHLPAARLLAAPETSTEEALRRAGLSDAIIEELLRPFLSGVFIDRELETSSHVLAMVLRSFARGRIGVPADGMAALPAAVAAPLPRRPARPATPRSRRSRPAGSHRRPARSAAGAVMVATDPRRRGRAAARAWPRSACTA